MFRTIELPPVLDTVAAHSLRSRLLASRSSALALDASAVERVGGIALQVLLAARRQWSDDGAALRIEKPSDAAKEAFALMGAAALFSEEVAL